MLLWFVVFLFVFLGFYDLSVEGDWRWTDCSEPTPWTVSNWGESQPNNLNGNQHCGQILNDGKYNDWQCNRTMQYICEITVKCKYLILLLFLLLSCWLCLLLARSFYFFMLQSWYIVACILCSSFFFFLCFSHEDERSILFETSRFRPALFRANTPSKENEYMVVPASLLLIIVNSYPSHHAKLQASLTDWQFIFSAFEPNDANPTRLRGIAVNPNTVTLTWRPSLVSCDVIGYRILYNNPLITTFQEVLGGNSTQITISGLTDGVPITFSIAGFTSEVLLTYETRVTVNMPSLDGEKSIYNNFVF